MVSLYQYMAGMSSRRTRPARENSLIDTPQNAKSGQKVPFCYIKFTNRGIFSLNLTEVCHDFEVFQRRFHPRAAVRETDGRITPKSVVRGDYAAHSPAAGERKKPRFETLSPEKSTKRGFDTRKEIPRRVTPRDIYIGKNC